MASSAVTVQELLRKDLNTYKINVLGIILAKTGQLTTRPSRVKLSSTVSYHFPNEFFVEVR